MAYRVLLSFLFLVAGLHCAFGQVHKVAILKPMDRGTDVPYSMLLALRTQLSSAIAKAPDHEALIREDLDRLAEEFKFQYDGPVPEEQRTAIGQMSGADLICISEIARDTGSYVISASIVELATGKVIASAVEIAEDNAAEVNSACAKVARALLSEGSELREPVAPAEPIGLHGPTPSEPQPMTTEEVLNTKMGKILLMNGDVLDTHVLGQSTLEIRYLEKRRNGTLRERAEATENVFSVIDSLGKEKIWYFHDTIFGNDLTPDQMRWFMNGERDARKGYKATWPMIEAFTIGAGLTIGLNLETNAFFIPPLVGIAMILPRVHVAKGSISNPLMEGDEFYATGYARVGRTKRVIRSIISGFVGVGVGLAANQLVINPNFRKP